MRDKDISKWTDEEANIYLQEEIRGECWHRYIQYDDYDVICKICGEMETDYDWNDGPDYCSSRDLCAEVLNDRSLNYRFQANAVADISKLGFMAKPRLLVESIIKAHLGCDLGKNRRSK